MIELLRIFVGVVLLAGSLWFIRRVIAAGRLYISISTSENGNLSTLVDGEKFAIEGTVNVKDSPPLSNYLSVDEEESVGAYVWRLKDSESYTYKSMVTYASGIESGTFSVNDSQHEIQIDTDWLAETHDSDDITTISPDWTVSTLLSKRSWISQYIHLDERLIVNSIPIMEYIFDAESPEEIPEDEYFEAKAILDGEILAVSGEVSMEQGTPVLQGSDKEPLVLSDQGFDELSHSLRFQILKYGLAAAGFTALGALALANGLTIV